MTARDLLPFEDRFRRWLEANGMGWSATRLPDPRGGAELAAYRLTPAGPARRLLLALHGAGNDALFGWVGLFKRLLLGGAEIHTFDLPGHGRAGASRFSAAAARTAIQAAAAWFDDRPDLPAHAVGVSLGGSLLLSALPDLGHRLASAALVVAPLRIELSLRAVLGELRPANVALLWREREHYGLTGLIPSFGPFKRDVYPLRLASRPPGGAFGYIAALNDELAALGLEQAAAAVRTPVLLAYGEDDRVVPPAQGDRLARLIPGATLLAVRGGTHLSTPLDPAVTERLERWIERCER